MSLLSALLQSEEYNGHHVWREDSLCLWIWRGKNVETYSCGCMSVKVGWLR